MLRREVRGRGAYTNGRFGKVREQALLVLAECWMMQRRIRDGEYVRVRRRRERSRLACLHVNQHVAVR